MFIHVHLYMSAHLSVYPLNHAVKWQVQGKEYCLDALPSTRQTSVLLFFYDHIN